MLRITAAPAAPAAPAAAVALAAATPKRPNIVVIISDDMGYSDIGCYGGEIHTPNTDALTDESVRMVGEALAEGPQRPFFLYLAYTAAHWPLPARESDIAKRKRAFGAGWDKLRDARMARMKGMGVIGAGFKFSPRHPLVPAWEQNKAWQRGE